MSLAGRSPFADIRRPAVEASSDVMFPDFYYKTLTNASYVSPNVHYMSFGPRTVQKIPLLPTPVQKPSTSSIHDQPGPPVNSSTPKKTAKPCPPDKATEQIHPDIQRLKLSECLPRRPRHADPVKSCITAEKEVECKVVQAKVIKQRDSELSVAAARLQDRLMADQEIHRKMVADKFFKQQKMAEIRRNQVENALIEVMTSTNERAKQTIDLNAENEARARREKLQINIELDKRKTAEKKKVCQSLVSLHTAYAQKYKLLLEVIDKCKDPAALKRILSIQIKTVSDNSKLIANQVIKAQQGNVLGEKDLNDAKIVVENVEAALNLAIIEDRKIDLAIEQKVADEARLAKETRLKAAAKKDEENLAECCDVAYLPVYLELTKYYEDVQIQLEPFLNDEKLKNFRFMVQKAASVTANAINAASGSHLRDKYQKLSNLLAGGKIEGQSVTVSSHPLGRLFVSNILAKLFVRQGKFTLYIKPELAFPFASILVNLWADYPDFGKLVHAHFLHECPYLAPMFNPQGEAQQIQILGSSSATEKLEEQEEFQNRMKGIVRLFGAVLITKPRNPSPNPPNMSQVWRWVAAMCNLKPRPGISVVLVMEMLEVAGAEFLSVYGAQARKMLGFICKEYYPLMEKVTTKQGPLSRLKRFLEQALKEGTIRDPSGKLPPNFW